MAYLTLAWSLIQAPSDCQSKTVWILESMVIARYLFVCLMCSLNSVERQRQKGEGGLRT